MSRHYKKRSALAPLFYQERLWKPRNGEGLPGSQPSELLKEPLCGKIMMLVITVF